MTTEPIEVVTGEDVIELCGHHYATELYPAVVRLLAKYHSPRIRWRLEVIGDKSTSAKDENVQMIVCACDENGIPLLGRNNNGTQDAP